MKALGDVREGADLISSLTEAARSLSLMYAGTPDDRAEASLQRYANTILPDLTEAVGPKMAAIIIRTFTGTVMAQKHRIESAGASRA